MPRRSNAGARPLMSSTSSTSFSVLKAAWSPGRSFIWGGSADDRLASRSTGGRRGTNRPWRWDRASAAIGRCSIASRSWERRLAERRIAGRVVSIEAEYSPEAIAAFLAATNAGNVLVPISDASDPHRSRVPGRGRGGVPAVSAAPVRISSWRRDAAPLTRSMPRCGSRTAPAWCSFRPVRPGHTRRRYTTCGALLKKFAVPAPLLPDAGRSCSSIISAASIRCSTRCRTAAPSSCRKDARRVRCARRSPPIASSCCRPRRRS